MMMPRGRGEAQSHAEVCAVVESSFSKLQEWLEKRMRSQEDLLRCLSNGCSPDGLAVKDTMCSRCSAVARADETPVFVQPRQERLEVIRPLEEEPLRKAAAALHEEQNEVDSESSSVEGIPLPGARSAKSLRVGRVDPTPDVGRHTSPAGLDTIFLPGSPTTEGIKSKYSDKVNPPETSPVMLDPPQDPDIKKLASVSSSSTVMTEIGTSASQRSSARLLGEDWQAKLMDVFDQLDLDLSGSIDRAEFTQAFEAVGLPPVRAFDVFGAMDSSANDVIDRMEWLNVIEEAASGSDAEIDLLLKFIERLATRQKSRGRIYQHDRKKPPFMIMRHDGIPRMCWDLLMMVLLFYISLTLPYSLGFGNENVLDSIDRVFDMLFCIDVCLNFRTSYIDRDDTIVVSGTKIACKYMKSWFLLDFMSSVPFDLVTAGLMPNLTPARLLKLGKIAKVMKLLRISKMLSAFEGSEVMEKMEEKTSSKASQTVVRLIQLMSLAFVLAHWLACFGAAIDSSALENYFVAKEVVPTRFQKYLAAVYWAMTTLSTVGYGDITPSSDQERAYTMVAMVVGGAFYGYIIGSVTSIVSDMDLNARAFYSRMDLIQSWLDSHNDIPKLLRRRVRKHFKLCLAEKSAMDDSSILTELSPELRADMAFFIIDSRVRSNPMFINIPNSALANLVDILQKNHTEPNEFIVKLGDQGIAMYILVDGVARYDKGMQWRVRPDAEKAVKFPKLTEGDSFGEEVIFCLEETYKYTVVAITPCSFHSISEGGFKTQFENMPELHYQMYSSFLKSRSNQEDNDEEKIEHFKQRHSQTTKSQPSLISPSSREES